MLLLRVGVSKEPAPTLPPTCKPAIQKPLLRQALVAEVEQEVRREKASKKEKKDKKDKHKKDKKSKKDKKQRKEVKPASPAFIDETDKIVEHDELNLNAPDKAAQRIRVSCLYPRCRGKPR